MYSSRHVLPNIFDFFPFSFSFFFFLSFFISPLIYLSSFLDKKIFISSLSSSSSSSSAFFFFNLFFFLLFFITLCHGLRRRMLRFRIATIKVPTLKPRGIANLGLTEPDVDCGLAFSEPRLALCRRLQASLKLCCRKTTARIQLSCATNVPATKRPVTLVRNGDLYTSGN